MQDKNKLRELQSVYPMRVIHIAVSVPHIGQAVKWYNEVNVHAVKDFGFK
jgi:hypothetical protein